MSGGLRPSWAAETPENLRAFEVTEEMECAEAAAAEDGRAPVTEALSFPRDRPPVRLQRGTNEVFMRPPVQTRREPRGITFRPAAERSRRLITVRSRRTALHLFAKLRVLSISPATEQKLNTTLAARLIPDRREPGRTIIMSAAIRSLSIAIRSEWKRAAMCRARSIRRSRRRETQLHSCLCLRPLIR